MTSFLTETLEDLIETLMRKFIRIDLDRVKSCSEMAMLDFNDVNDQKPTHLVDLGFAVNHEIQLLKSSTKITDSQKLKFKKYCGVFSDFVYSFNGKKPSEIIFARYLHCLSPNYILECSETYEKVFDKVLFKLFSAMLLLLILPTALSHSTASLLLLLSKRISHNFETI